MDYFIFGRDYILKTKIKFFNWYESNKANKHINYGWSKKE